MSDSSPKGSGVRILVEVIGVLGVIASLLLLAWEVRQNTVASRASAIQQIGIATAEMWGEISRDPLALRIVESRSDIPSEEWTSDDWARFLTQMVAWSRLAETGLLQVEEGLLPPSSLETLGYSSTKQWLLVPELQCLWAYRLRGMVSEQFAAYVESEIQPDEDVECSQFTSFPYFESSWLAPGTADR